MGRYATIYLTGMTFLNLSFLQLEIDLLKHSLGANYTVLLAAAMLEEEKGSEETEKDQSGKEINLIFHFHNLKRASLLLFSQKMKWITFESSLHKGYSKKFSPPPEPTLDHFTVC